MYFSLMATRLRFKHAERLKRKSTIDALFAKGNRIHEGPISLVWILLDDCEDSRVKVGVSVSKRLFKKAVDRNRIKRLLREGYRLNQLSLKETLEKQDVRVAFFLIYRGRRMPEFKGMEGKIILTLQRLEETIRTPKV